MSVGPAAPETRGVCVCVVGGVCVCVVEGVCWGVAS